MPRRTSQNAPVKRVTEWRVPPKDRSKRVAPGGEIEEKHIIHGTRKRKDFNYKVFAEDYYNFSDEEEEKALVDEYVFPIKTRNRVRKSVNSQERRLDRYDANDPDSIKALTDKVKKLRLRKRKEKKHEEKPRRGRKSKKVLESRDVNQEESEEEEVEEQEQEQEQEQEEVVEKKEEKKVVQPQTPQKTRKRRKSLKSKTQKTGMSKEVFDTLKKLGTKYEKRSARKYNGQEIPAAIQDFLDHRLPEGNCLNNESLEVENVLLSGEYLLTPEEMKEYKWLRENKDAILVADGDYIVAAKLSDKNADFELFVIDDEAADEVYGPYKVSEFLKGATLGEAPEEDMEDEE